MKPIDTLVKLGIVEYVDHCGGAFWAVGDWITHDPDQILSNNDVMAAVMGRCARRGFFVEVCQNNQSGRFVASIIKLSKDDLCEQHGEGDHENLTTAIILAGLQALEGK